MIFLFLIINPTDLMEENQPLGNIELTSHKEMSNVGIEINSYLPNNEKYLEDVKKTYFAFLLQWYFLKNY